MSILNETSEVMTPAGVVPCRYSREQLRMLAVKLKEHNKAVFDNDSIAEIEQQLKEQMHGIVQRAHLNNQLSVGNDFYSYSHGAGYAIHVNTLSDGTNAPKNGPTVEAHFLIDPGILFLEEAMQLDI